MKSGSWARPKRSLPRGSRGAPAPPALCPRPHHGLDPRLPPGGLGGAALGHLAPVPRCPLTPGLAPHRWALLLLLAVHRASAAHLPGAGGARLLGTEHRGGAPAALQRAHRQPACARPGARPGARRPPLPQRHAHEGGRGPHGLPDLRHQDPGLVGLPPGAAGSRGPAEGAGVPLSTGHLIWSAHASGACV